MIETEELVKSYGNLLAVDHLNLRVPAGQVFGFLGPNGAGKTSTIKMLVGLLKPSSGIVKIGGADMAKEPRKAKAMLGYIPDRSNLYPLLTGWETMRLVAGLYDMPFAGLEEKARSLLEVFGIAQWSGERVESYSHGMRQKLMMAAALLHEPQILILDEPMVGLDPQGARLVKTLLRRLADEGKCVFLSLHTLEVAEKICDRLAILMHGRLLAEGSVEEIKKLSGRTQGGDLEEAFLDLTSAGSSTLSEAGQHG